MMATFQVGQRVSISCDIHPGAFPGEFLVTLETQDGVSSGFVRAEHVTLSSTSKARGSIQGIIRAIEGDAITVQLPGSFFTTAMGLTTFPASWATENVTLATSA